jgi:hypothetical protein
MSSPLEGQTDPLTGQAIRSYAWLGYAGLAAILLGLLLRRHNGYAFFPIAVGFTTLMLRWRSGPVLSLAALAWFLASASLGLTPQVLLHEVYRSLRLYVFYGSRGFAFNQPIFTANWVVRRNLPAEVAAVADSLLAVGFLAYVASSYRLHALLGPIFPEDPRRPPPAERLPRSGPVVQFPEYHGAQAGTVQRRRVPPVAAKQEIGQLLILFPACVLLAQVLWSWLSTLKPEGDIPIDIRQVLMVSSLIILGLVGGNALVGYLNWSAQSRSEAAMYLQDTIWNETGREQRSIAAWLAWAHRRRRQRGERP